MKYILIIILLLSFKSYSQDGWNIGMSLGLRCEQGWDSKTQSEHFGATNFLFNIPVSYQKRMFIGEISGMYSGDITASLSGGVVLPIAERVSLQLMGGVADNIYPNISLREILTEGLLNGGLKTIQVTNKFYGTGIARLQIGTFYIQYQQISTVSFFGLGLRGLLNE